MAHLPDLIKDLALILTVAAVVSLLFKRLKQPVVLGYIVAGFLVSPNVGLLPTVSDQQSIRIWAEIGVIVLLFNLGLEFSFKKLARVGWSAGVTALIEIPIMMIAGYFVGNALEWSYFDSVFLAGILCISSTTIIIRAIEELGLKSRRFVHQVYGVLVVEDLVAVLLLVFLTTLSMTKTLSGATLAMSTLRLGFFLVLWFVAGIFFIPFLLRHARAHLDGESRLFIALGLCFLMVVFASSVGFSAALGAFVMGSILAETTEAEVFESLLKPIKDLFAGVFFVSVGMLMDPAVITARPGALAAIVGTIIVGKVLGVSFGALVSGQPLKQALQVGFSLAQIGEFSFIIATLGRSLGVVSESLYPLTVAASAITTFTTPYAIRLAPHFANLIEKALPHNVHRRLEQYGLLAQSIFSSSESSRAFRLGLIQVIFSATVVVAITLLGSKVATPQTEAVVAAAVILLAAPFLWAVAFGKSGVDVRQAKIPALFARFIRMLIAVLLLGIALAQVTSLRAALFTVAVMILLMAVTATRLLEPAYRWFEVRFISNLMERERSEKSRFIERPVMAPWDAHLTEFVISAQWAGIGQTLQSLTLTEKFGVTVALIERGERRITSPGRDDMLMPYDRIFVIGSDEQLDAFRMYLSEQVALEKSVTSPGDYVLQTVKIAQSSIFCGRAIRDSGIRERTNGLIVGIERGGKRILNPHSALEIQAGDLLWVVGDRKKLLELS